MFHYFFISVRRSTCFRRLFHPSSAAQNCTYSVRYLSDKYLTMYVQFWDPDDGRNKRLKHVERLTEIKKLWNFASCWLYFANPLLSLSQERLCFRASFNYHASEREIEVKKNPIICKQTTFGGREQIPMRFKSESEIWVHYVILLLLALHEPWLVRLLPSFGPESANFASDF